MRPDTLRNDIVKPTLRLLDEVEKGYYSDEAVELLVGTAAHESHLGKWFKQVNGPALGIFQMEPATHNSLWQHYLRFRPDVARVIRELASHRAYKAAGGIPSSELVHNLMYATAMARVRYRPAKGHIPDTLVGQAHYWKQWYNTPLGRGTVEKYLEDYRQFVEGE